MLLMEENTYTRPVTVQSVGLITLALRCYFDLSSLNHHNKHHRKPQNIRGSDKLIITQVREWIWLHDSQFH
jgi:hypothetical protein